MKRVDRENEREIKNEMNKEENSFHFCGISIHLDNTHPTLAYPNWTYFCGKTTTWPFSLALSWAIWCNCCKYACVHACVRLFFVFSKAKDNVVSFVSLSSLGVCSHIYAYPLDRPAFDSFISYIIFIQQVFSNDIVSSGDFLLLFLL